jgi:hypothetical protein
MRCHRLLNKLLCTRKVTDTKEDFIHSEAVNTKEEPTTQGDSLGGNYGLPPVHARGLAALGRRSNASAAVTAIAAAIIVVPATVAGKAVIVFGSFGAVGSFI